ncbi:MAG: signal peptidase I [Firmicutes bacterium]|nr:signal peptidase I [Dethiobacter sp.]MBS3888213.1 signal peptidase I [Bacillota bacterium]
MEIPVAKNSSLRDAVHKFSRHVGNSLFVISLVLAVVLVFFLIQSRVTGGVPAVLGHQLYIVGGGSMSPAFSAGSVVMVRPQEASTIRLGDIITYRDPDSNTTAIIVTHRVVGIAQGEALTFTTRGDANHADDPLPLPASNIIGRVAYTIPFLGYVLSFMQTKNGMLLMLVLPASVVIVVEVRKLMGYARSIDNQGGGCV